MATTLSSVEDEKCFSLLSSMKKQIEKLIDVPFGSCHVNVCQFFYIMETFPLTTTIRSWNQ
jgi:hypothetical protein